MASNCRGCGARIEWGITPDGQTRVPLDPKPPIYRPTGEKHPDGTLVVERAGNVLVSHFATCPKASDFSKARR